MELGAYEFFLAAGHDVSVGTEFLLGLQLRQKACQVRALIRYLVVGEGLEGSSRNLQSSLIRLLLNDLNVSVSIFKL